MSLRSRINEAAQRKVRAWIFGVEANFPGDPRRRLIGDPTSSTDVKLVQYHANDGYPVTVGRYSGVTHTATILQGGIHHADWVSIVGVRRVNGQWVFPNDAMASNGPVVVGSDALIGYEAFILSGVTIGHGAVVAARSVVVKDVEPYSIVGGNPARHIKYRFDEPTRQALLRIAWWDWPDEKIEAHRNELDSPDVAAFVRKHDPLQQPD